jgi:hypothetical protein
MGDLPRKSYALRMIVSERMQPIGTNRVVFRQLSLATSYAAPTPQRYAVCQPVKWYRLDLSPAWLNHKMRISNWVMALSLVATLGISAAVSVAVVSQSATPVPIVAVVPISAPASSVPAAKMLPTLGAPSISPAESISYAQITTLQDQLQSMNTDLQGLHQESDTLRNESHAQENDLASARTNLAGSQESLQGQSEQLNGRLGAIQQDLQSRLNSLDQSLTSAVQVVSDVRSVLGLPASPSQSAVGGQ